MKMHSLNLVFRGHFITNKSHLVFAFGLKQIPAEGNALKTNTKLQSNCDTSLLPIKSVSLQHNTRSLTVLITGNSSDPLMQSR
jgi:hypothetical protein